MVALRLAMHCWCENWNEKGFSFQRHAGARIPSRTQIRGIPIPRTLSLAPHLTGRDSREDWNEKGFSFQQILVPADHSRSSGPLSFQQRSQQKSPEGLTFRASNGKCRIKHYPEGGPQRSNTMAVDGLAQPERVPLSRHSATHSRLTDCDSRERRARSPAAALCRGIRARM